MSAKLETRIATFLATVLASMVPVLAATQPLAAGICGALATGLVAAYHVRTARDRRAARAQRKALNGDP
jgi:fructose-specific phosphotransferase system IIC component